MRPGAWREAQSALSSSEGASATPSEQPSVELWTVGATSEASEHGRAGEVIMGEEGVAERVETPDGEAAREGTHEAECEALAEYAGGTAIRSPSTASRASTDTTL